MLTCNIHFMHNVMLGPGRTHIKRRAGGEMGEAQLGFISYVCLTFLLPKV